MPCRENAYAVIMAGGKGERFWPQSRLSHPKQLLRLLGNLTLIEQTVVRLQPLFDPSRIIVITNSDYAAPMRSLLSKLPSKNIIAEPSGRDTAPCIALAAAYIKSISPANSDPAICVLPSDHVINDTASFQRVIADCVDIAESKEKLITIGIKPTMPSTGYGYIAVGDAFAYDKKTEFRAGLGFKEKPNIATAEDYIASGKYKWNSGMFIMTHSTLMKAFGKHAPSIADFHDDILTAIMSDDVPYFNELYTNVEKISFDYAVMEKISGIAVASCDFDWDDVGSWTSMRNQIRPEKNNNVVCGLHAGIDTRNCVIVGNSKHLIATIDVDDLVVVTTDDATLVCSAKSAQRVKEIVHLIGSKPELSSFL